MTENQQEKITYLRNNLLFEGLNDEQLSYVAGIIETLKINTHDIFIEENENSNDIYILKEGAVEIFKYDEDEQNEHLIVHLHPGDIIGEIALIDNTPRTASARATQPTTLYMLSVNRLIEAPLKNLNLSYFSKMKNYFKSDRKARAAIHSKILQNAAKKLSERVRHSNNNIVRHLKEELKVSKARVEFGKFTINVLVTLSIFILFLGLLNQWKFLLSSTTYLSVALTFLFAVPLYIMMRHSGYPLSMYGLTTHHWKKSLRDAIIFSIPVLIVIGLAKFIAIHSTELYAHNHLFDFNTALVSSEKQSGLLDMRVFIPLMLYTFCLVPLQEFVARGALQSSLQELMTGRHSNAMAILVSNLLFSSIHVYISLYFALVVFLPGLFWGFLYARHRTLIGPIVSHALIGFFALAIIGLRPM